MADLLAACGLLLATWLIYKAVSQFLRGRVSAYALSMLGLGGLVLLDIPKHYWTQNAARDFIDEDHFVVSVSVILLSALLMALGRLFGKRYFRASRPGGWRAISHGRVRILGLALGVAVAGLVLIASRSGYVALLSGAMRGALVLVLCYGIYRRRYGVVILSSVLLAAFILSVDLTSRRAYVAMFVPVFITIVANFSRGGVRISLAQRIALLLVGFLCFVSLNALRAQHDFGEGYDPSDPVGNTVSYITTLRSVDTFSNTAFLIKNFPDSWDYFYGLTYAAVLVGPVPRSYWPDKPVGLAAPLGLMRRMGVRDFSSDLWQESQMFSLSPGFVGEAWANGGIAGVILLSLLFGTATALYDRKVPASDFSLENIPLYCVLPIFLLAHRGDFYSAVNFCLFMFVGATIALRLCSRPRRSTVDDVP